MTASWKWPTGWLRTQPIDRAPQPGRPPGTCGALEELTVPVVKGPHLEDEQNDQRHEIEREDDSFGCAVVGDAHPEDERGPEGASHRQDEVSRRELPGLMCPSRAFRNRRVERLPGRHPRDEPERGGDAGENEYPEQQLAHTVLLPGREGRFILALGGGSGKELVAPHPCPPRQAGIVLPRGRRLRGEERHPTRCAGHCRVLRRRFSKTGRVPLDEVQRSRMFLCEQ